MAHSIRHLRFSALLLPLALSACATENEDTTVSSDAVAQTKQACTSGRRHVILVIGDGMQLAHEVAASRYLYGKDKAMAWQKPMKKHGYVTTWDVTTYNKYAGLLGAPAWTADSANPLIGYDPSLGGALPYPMENPASALAYYSQGVGLRRIRPRRPRRWQRDGRPTKATSPGRAAIRLTAR
jgi:hypothetical protein